MTKILNMLWQMVYSVIFAIGIVTVVRYADKHFPRILSIVTAVILVAVVVGYTWTYIIKPFRQGMNEPNQTKQ